MRQEAHGQNYKLTRLDRLAPWLSARRMRKACGDMTGKVVADIGSGYHANLTRNLVPQMAKLYLADLALAPEVAGLPNVEPVLGYFPNALAAIPDNAVDIVICNSVIEHVWHPQETINEMHRMLKPGGVAFINVPSWPGKTVLELMAFRLNLAPADEMNDHKLYYNPRDLWPLLVRAGFVPQRITCRWHKLFMCTYAVCRKEAG